MKGLLTGVAQQKIHWWLSGLGGHKCEGNASITQRRSRSIQSWLRIKGIKVCTARSFEKETDKMERSNGKSLLHEVFVVLTGDCPIKAGLCSTEHLLYL